MTIDISNNAARVNYTVAQGVTQTSFSVPFEFFNDADLSVYVDDVLKTITTHYTVSGGDGSTGTITMSVTGASGGSTVVISRSIAIERTSDFVTGVDINRAALNTQLDTLTAIAADNKDKASRSISAPNSEVNPQLELPDANTRKGKLVGFNETTGNVQLTASIADVNTLAAITSDIATLADIEDGTDATDAIQTVAGISSNVTTVAGISANVTAVAGNESNINTVAADESDIGIVAGSIASVNTNAANITDIQNASANAATATTKASEALTSATNAATSETNAATSETNAATSASTATTQAGISTTKAGESAASATAAASSASSAQASKDAALAALDSFDDRYLGQKTADPTVDNDGDALVSGALYFNTTDDIMKVYDGSLWVAAYASLSGAMFGANNLSDVASISASRTTLGLGTGDTPTFAGINTTGNATFGDNDKAIFGAGSDLEIYHDGTHSYIDDASTGGWLFVRASELRLQDQGGTNTYLLANSGGAVSIRHANAEKFTTTSTGIDVTGTVTADGLTLSDADAPTITVTDTTNTTTTVVKSGNNTGVIGTTTAHDLDIRSDNTDRLTVLANGDISFYEDTGTTPKFFWDASAESLGIGTSSPSEKLVLANGSNEIKIGQDGSSHDIFSNGKTFNIGTIDGTVLRLFENNSEVMRLSGGNLLVGKSSADFGASVGMEMRNNDTLYVARSGGASLALNRTTSDGPIAEFRKDGNTVGSIAADGGFMSIGTGDVGLAFNSTVNTIHPNNQGTLAGSDGQVDLGYTNVRFKDGYFSGTVNAANFNTTSDATLKTNVETLSGSLDAVKSLRGVSFDWLENGGSEIGVIAQEVEAVLPDVVSTNDEGIKSVKYGNMVAVLIEAIKEQQAQIDELKAKLGE